MRTTVTLDPDVAAKLKQTARERGVPFKVALNDSVRAGLSSRAGTEQPYRLPTRPLRVRAGIDLDRASRLADGLEDAELLRKLELRK
jgi:hypothetical protein